VSNLRDPEGFASLWTLDPAVEYLNHGSFGACPAAVLAHQAALRGEMEREPMDFLSGGLAARLDVARGALAAFVGAEPEDLVFVPNATAGVNAVLRSLSFEPADEILITTHTYNACRKTVEYVAARSGARVVTAPIPFPGVDPESAAAAVLDAASERTRLALIDHVTSPTALILPIERLVDQLEARGIDTLIDGAHAPGMVPLALSGLNAAYYTGNAHKWLCAPKGAAFLHVRRDRQRGLHPNVISHGYAAGFHAEFDWTGTQDPTPALCIPEAIRYLGTLVPGGWGEIMTRNHALIVEARNILLRELELDPPCPESMIGSMASMPLPERAAQCGLDPKALHDWLRERGVEAWLHPRPVPLLRLSAQLYNDVAQYAHLGRLIQEALRGR
jgi:isopenicillin-N epimerase